MVVKVSGRTTLVRLVQPEKANPLILVTPLGMMILVKLVQL